MPTWLPFALLGVFFLGGVALVLYFFFGGEDEDENEGYDGGDTLAITASDGTKDPLASTAEEFRQTARKSRMIALKESLERSLDSREGGAQLSAKDRLAMPWFLLVGADGSGKKTILANTGMDLPWGPPIEVDSQRKDAGKWWLFDSAIVLEAPPAAPGSTAGMQTLPPGMTVPDTSVGWNTLLHMLRRERPDSPLNGIIVTISCAELMSARVNPERMEEQADRIRAFLERTREFLGVRLPLHVLVTKCDTLPGFRSFAQSLPASRRDDIFGWANPNDPEARFEPSWVDKGFTAIQEHLAVLRDEVLAAPEHVRDSVGVFVFDSEFADLQEPLKSFVARLMTIGERRPSLFFRGFYFSGDIVESSAPEPTTMPEGKTVAMASLSTEIAREPHQLVFLKTLFATKIFKEAGLARPAAKLRLSRDRRVVAAQAAAIAIALVGGSGLWTTLNGRDTSDQPGLRADAATLTRILSGVAIDMDELRQGGTGTEDVLDRRTRDAAVIELVAQMRDVPTARVRSPFIPTSWFSPLPNEIRQAMMAGIQNIVLPVTRQRLQERAQRLLLPRTAADSVISDELDPADPRTLTTYLADVRRLSANINRYNTLASPTGGSVAELSALLDYLFGERIAPDSGASKPDFEEALKLAAGEPIRVSSAMAQSVVSRSVRMIATVANNASRQLAPRTGAAERTIKPEEDLEALRALYSLVELTEPRRGLVSSVSDSVIMGMKLARVVEDSIRAQLTLAAQRIAPRDTVAADSAYNRLRSAISSLYSYRLMERIEGRSIVTDIAPNQRLRWDVGRLELALALPAEFLQAVVAITPAFPGQSPDRLTRALQVQLRARVVDVAASAQGLPSLSGERLDPNLELKSRVDNLEIAVPRITRLVSMLDTMKAGPEGRKLLTAALRQAERAVARAQRILDRDDFYEVKTDGVASWPGVVPIGFKAIGAVDPLRFDAAIIANENRIRTLTQDLAPALKFLRYPAVQDSVRIPKLLAEWEVLSSMVARADRADPTSTMTLLKKYLKEGMGMSDPAVCATAAAEPDTIKPSTDLFVVRRRQFHAALVSRCKPGGSTEAVAAYLKLRLFFQTRLAGRYPFVDSTAAPNAIDADPQAVREFLRQYDAFEVVNDVSLRSDPSLVPLTRGAGVFLDQMKAVRELFGSFVDADSRRAAPEFAMTVALGPAAKSDTAPVDLELQMAGRQLPLTDEEQEEEWRSGDAIRLVMTPMDTTRARTLFINGGAWSALRFAQMKGNWVTVRLYTPDTKLDLPLPPFPSDAPELAMPGTVRPPTPAPVAPVAPPITQPSAGAAKAPAPAAKSVAPTTKSVAPTTKSKAAPTGTKRGSKAPPAKTKTKSGATKRRG